MARRRGRRGSGGARHGRERSNGPATRSESRAERNSSWLPVVVIIAIFLAGVVFILASRSASSLSVDGGNSSRARWVFSHRRTVGPR